MFNKKDDIPQWIKGVFAKHVSKDTISPPVSEKESVIINTIFKIVDDLMGYPGRMLSGSKRAYANNHQDHLVIFNGNLFIQLNNKYLKIWYGDVDFTHDKTTLIKLSKQLDTVIFLLREMDGRFEFENEPKIEKAVKRIYPDGMIYE